MKHLYGKWWLLGFRLYRQCEKFDRLYHPVGRKAEGCERL